MKDYIGKPVIVRFYDHAANSKPIECKVIGFLAKENALNIALVCWDCINIDEQSRLNNMEYYSILKSTIIEICLLRKYGKIT